MSYLYISVSHPRAPTPRNYTYAPVTSLIWHTLETYQLLFSFLSLFISSTPLESTQSDSRMGGDIMSSSIRSVSKNNMRFVLPKRTCPLSSSISKTPYCLCCIKANPSSHTSAFDRVSVLVTHRLHIVPVAPTFAIEWCTYDELDHQHEHNTCTHTVFTDLSMIFLSQA
jgi:hypothetical protein